MMARGINIPRLYRNGRSFALAYTKALGGFVYDFYTSIHPRSESQFAVQKAISGAVPWYGSWLVSRSLDEKNRNTRQYYNLKWSDITYPWLSGVTSSNQPAVLGSSWQFSKNIANLYK